MLFKLLSLLLLVAFMVQEGEFKSSGPVYSLLFKHVQARLNSLSEDKIPDIFKKGRLAKNNALCCNVDQPLLTQQATQLVSNTVSVPMGVQQCGTEWCWNIEQNFQCPIYCTTYEEVIRYNTEVFTFSQPQACPPNEVKCCDGFISVLGECFDFTEVQQNLDLTQFLNNQQ